jgi:hypothetical protein
MIAYGISYFASHHMNLTTKNEKKIVYKCESTVYKLLVLYIILNRVRTINPLKQGCSSGSGWIRIQSSQ